MVWWFGAVRVEVGDLGFRVWMGFVAFRFFSSLLSWNVMSAEPWLRDCLLHSLKTLGCKKPRTRVWVVGTRLRVHLCCYGPQNPIVNIEDGRTTSAP